LLIIDHALLNDRPQLGSVLAAGMARNGRNGPAAFERWLLAAHCRKTHDFRQ